MIPYLPTVTVAEKYHKRFWQRVGLGKLNIGEEVTACGYLIRAKQADGYAKWFDGYRRSLGIKHRAYFFTPVPSAGAYRFSSYKKSNGIIAIVSSHFKVPHGPVRVTGRIYDFKKVSSIPWNYGGGYLVGGKCLYVASIEKMDLKEYFSLEKPGVDGNTIKYIVDSAFDEDLITPFLLKFSAASVLYNYMAGVVISFGAMPSKFYGIRNGEWKLMTDLVPEYLSSGEAYRTLVELSGRDDIVKIDIRGGKRQFFPVGYVIERNVKKHIDFLERVRPRPDVYGVEEEKKKGRFERSDAGLASNKADILASLSHADVPYIPNIREARVVDGDIVREYSMDMAYFALWKYLEEPVANPAKYEKVYLDIIGRIKDWNEDMYEFINIPEEIIERLKLGIPTLKNSEKHFGAHLRKMVNAIERIGVQNPVDFLWENVLLTFLERYYDNYSSFVTQSLALAQESSRNMLRVLRLGELLDDLNMVYGWWTLKSFVTGCFTHAVEMDERRAEELLEHLYRKGYVLRRFVDGKEEYRAVAHPPVRW